MEVWNGGAGGHGGRQVRQLTWRFHFDTTEIRSKESTTTSASSSSPQSVLAIVSQRNFWGLLQRLRSLPRHSSVDVLSQCTSESDQLSRNSRKRLKMDQVMAFLEPGRQFAKDSLRLVKRCTKPDRKGKDYFVKKFKKQFLCSTARTLYLKRLYLVDGEFYN